MIVKINPVEIKFGEVVKNYLTAVNISGFKYELFGEGINVYCQTIDEAGCIFNEKNIFLNKETLNNWKNDDNYLVNEILIRLGFEKYCESKPPKRSVKK